MRRLVFAVALLSSLLAVLAPALAPASAQTPAAAPPQPGAALADTLPSTPAHPSGRTRTGRMTQAQRFEAANTTHDGRLTLDQARAGHMAAVVRDWSAIDKDSKGYVTLTDIRAQRRAARAARKAAAKS